MNGSVCKILVIDDEVLVANALRRALRGNHVTVVHTAQEAIDLFHRDTAFDVVLCDLMLPDLSGKDVFQAAEKIDQALAKRFVFLSGGVVNRDLREFLDAVPNQTITKPFEPATVRELVKSHGPSSD